MRIPVQQQAAAATRKPNASQQELQALGRLFDELKTGNAETVAKLCGELTEEETLPLEAQLLAFQLLQHLVTYRWEEFSTTDQRRLGEMASNLLVRTGNPRSTWAIRSKAALLLALVTKRMGTEFWEGILPELLQFANQGAVQTEKVCMVLRLVNEEVTWTNDGAAGPEVSTWRRQMLASLTAALASILPFLNTTLEVYYGRAHESGRAGDHEAVQMHAATVTAALAAVKEYAEWAPVGRLSASKIIASCAFLACTPEFRAPACEALRSIAVRRQAQESPELFQPAMAETGEALVRAAEQVLQPQQAAELGVGGELEDFAQLVCASLGMWGYTHLATLPPERRLHFLQLSIAFMRHDYQPLVHKALPLWISLLGAAERAQRGSKEESQIPLDCAAALMDIAGEKLQGALPLAEDSADFPEPFESFEEYRSFTFEYRDLLTRIVKLAAALLPEPALQVATRRLHHTLEVCSTSEQQSQHALEATAQFVESVVTTVSQTFLPGGRRRPSLVANVSPEAVGAILDAQESMFRALLGVHFRSPAAIACLCSMLEAFARLIALRKELTVPAIEKVFDMFNDLALEGGPWHLPPGGPPAWKERLQARSKIPIVLTTFARLASDAMGPHVEALAIKTEECWRSRSISPAERAQLCDMMIAAVSSAELAFQQQVVEHVLRSTCEEWRSLEWREHLSTPAALVAHFCPIVRNPAGGFEIGGGLQRWLAAHHLQIVERALKRLPASADAGAADCGTPGGRAWHVLNAHLEWMLPTLLQLTATLHSLSTQQGLALLAEAAPAMQMGPRERALYLRQLTRDRQLADAGIREEEDATIAGSNVAALRSWFRVAREGLYQTLGCLVRHVGGFFSHADMQPAWVAATVGCLEAMHASHIRMLIRHVVIPLVKTCPRPHRHAWALPVLSALLPHVHQRLTTGWTALLEATGRGGATPAPPGARSTEASAAANDEVIEECLLRELTAEHLILLRCMQDAPEVDGKVQQSLLELLWKESPTAAMAACWTAVATLWWPDDVITRASAFLRGVVGVVGRPGLEESAGREILRGCIQAISGGHPGPSSEVVGLVRDVLIIKPPLPGPREVLCSLPRVTPATVGELDAVLFETNSEPKQRSAIKQFLANSGSEQLHAALSDWRPVSGVTNMAEPRLRIPKLEDHGWGDLLADASQG